MKPIYLSKKTLLPFMIVGLLFETKAQTVYNLVVGGSKNITINSAHSYDNQTCGDDPNQFGSGGGSASHDWSVTRNRGFMTTNLPGGLFSYTTNPDNSVNSITLLSANLTPGQFSADDNYYGEFYAGHREKNCVLARCDYPSPSCTDGGRINSAVTQRFVFNIENAPRLLNKLNFNSATNTYTVCSGDTAFSIYSLVDNQGGYFFFPNDANVPYTIFNPRANASTTPGGDTTINMRYFKSYDNGTTTVNIRIKVLTAGKITTASTNHTFSTCKNVSVPDITAFIKATPGGGTYTYNASPITSISPSTYATNSIVIAYSVQIGSCMSYDTNTVNFLTVPTITDVTTLGTYCNNTKNLALNSTTFRGFFTEMYAQRTYKYGQITGPGVKTKSASTTPRVVTVNGVRTTYYDADTLLVSTLAEGKYVLTYQLFDPVTNCANTDTFNVVIKAPTVLSYNDSTFICNQQATYKMSNDVLPKGGKFTPSFQSYLLNDSTLNVKNIPLGSIVVKYTYTNSFGCVSTANLSYNVKLKPNVTMPADTSFCEGAKPKTFKALPIGGVWSGQGVTPEGIFDPTTVQASSYYKLTYSVSIGTCSDSKTMYATVLKNPVTPSIVGGNTNYCTGDSINLYATVANTSGLTYRWYKNDDTVPFSKSTALALIADKSLRRILVESVNSQGCASSTRAETVFILTEVSVKLTLSKYHLTKGDFIYLDSKTQGDQVTDAIWTFGDGTTGRGPNLVHYYYDTGRVTVKCKILTQNGCAITKYADSTLYIKGIPYSIETAANGPSGSDFESLDNFIQIYPNPSESTFNLYVFKQEGETTMEVKDVYGRTLVARILPQLASMELALPELPSGTYLLSFKNNLSNKDRLYRIVKK